MNTHTFAAEAGPLIFSLMQSWIAHLQTETETLVKDRPAWAPDALVAEATRVALQCRSLQRRLTRLDREVTAMTRAIPDHLAGDGQPWAGAEEPWPAQAPGGRDEPA